MLRLANIVQYNERRSRKVTFDVVIGFAIQLSALVMVHASRSFVFECSFVVFFSGLVRNEPLDFRLVVRSDQSLIGTRLLDD